MAKLDLNQDEHAVLVELLESAVFELGGEIADTDSFDFRNDLKAKKQIVSDILARLKSA